MKTTEPSIGDFVRSPLKTTEIPEARDELLKQQFGLCALCKLPVDPWDSVHLDHDHRTGAVRGTLHGPCNRTLGIIEQAMKEFKVKDKLAFLAGAGPYLEHHSVDQTGLIHPNHKVKPKRKAP